MLDLNVQSLRNADPSGFKITLQPHYVTRRYAELVAAMIVIKNQGPEQARVTALVKQMQLEMDSLVMRMAAEFTDRKLQLIFMINNYDAIWSVMQEHIGQEDSRDTEAVKSVLALRSADFVEQLLSPYFGPMIEFIKHSEGAVDRGQPESIKVDESTCHRSFKQAFNQLID